METKPFYFYTENPFTQFYSVIPNQFQDHNGVGYISAEQYMMAKKALLFNDKVNHDYIMHAKKSIDCKMLGRQVLSFNQKIWDQYKVPIVFGGNLLKFSQNPEYAKVLLDLYKEGYRFVEASPYDRVWGIGISKEDAENGIPWKGQNLLGHCLNMVAKTLLISDIAIQSNS